MREIVISFQFLVFSVCLGAESLPLSTSYWRDPAFQKAFNGSYRIEARIEPNVSSEERELLIEVQDLMADGKRGAALEKLKGSALTEKSAALTFNLANLHFETGEIAAAVKGYRGAIEAYPSFRRAHRNLAVALVREGENDEALPHLVEALRLGDAEGTTYGMLGYIRLAREEWASALQAYRLAQVTEPEVAEWKAGIAQCLQYLDDPQQAIALLDEVIRQRPLEAVYAVLQANVFLGLERPDAAVKALELPARLGLLGGDHLLLLADLHLRASRRATAVSHIETAFELEEKPGKDAVLELVRSASARVDWPLAKELLGRIDGDETAATRLARVRFLIESGEDAARGAEELGKLLEDDPVNGQALLSLAKYLVGVDQVGRAELLLERATAEATSAFDAFVELTRLHVSQGRYGDALEALDAAIALNGTPELVAYREALKQTLLASE